MINTDYIYVSEFSMMSKVIEYNILYGYSSTWSIILLELKRVSHIGKKFIFFKKYFEINLIKHFSNVQWLLERFFSSLHKISAATYSICEKFNFACLRLRVSLREFPMCFGWKLILQITGHWCFIGYRWKAFLWPTNYCNC